MASIQELRQQLQAARRSADTIYGRHVMRFFSIYLTWFFNKLGWRPSAVTLLSIAVGVMGAWGLASGYLLMGVLCVNGWYLLDHVDGEMARLQRRVSAAGLFLDTIANPIIFPAFFFSIGFYLFSKGLDYFWLTMGLTAAYGSMMVMMISYCESMVILEKLTSIGTPKDKSINRPLTSSTSSSAKLFSLRTAFSALHRATTFPVALPSLTLLILIFWFVDRNLLDGLLKVFLFFYAAAQTFVWVVVLGYAGFSKKIDKEIARWQ